MWRVRSRSLCAAEFYGSGLRDLFNWPCRMHAVVRCQHVPFRALAASASKQDKQIAIVGGGLGGLTAARVLERHGFKPLVFERDAHQGAREQGGTLDLHPDSGQWALEQAGLTEQFRAAARPEGQDTRILDKDGTVLWEETGSTGMERPETDRPVLRRMLLDSLQPGTVQWDHQLTAVELTDPSSNGSKHRLHFADGRSHEADLVIGADGARSKIRPLLTDAVPTYQGLSGVVLGIPDADVRSPEAAKTVGHGMMMASAQNKGIYGQRSGSGKITLWTMFRTKEGTWAELGVQTDNAEQTRKALIAKFDGWAPELTNLIAACDDTIRLWPCYALPVGLTWHRESEATQMVTLLGDAAHLMSPFAGEGANLAMQDGAELALALASHDSVVNAVTEYEGKMFKRAQPAAEESARNQELFISEDGSREIVKFFKTAFQ